MGKNLFTSDESSVESDCWAVGIASYILKSTGLFAISFEEITLGLASNIKLDRSGRLINCHDSRAGRKTADWTSGLLMLDYGITTSAVIFWRVRRY